MSSNSLYSMEGTNIDKIRCYAANKYGEIQGRHWDRQGLSDQVILGCESWVGVREGEGNCLRDREGRGTVQRLREDQHVCAWRARVVQDEVWEVLWWNKDIPGLCPQWFLVQRFKNCWNFLSDRSDIIMLMRWLSRESWIASGLGLVTRKTKYVIRGLALW